MRFLGCDELRWKSERSYQIPLKKITVQNHVCCAAVKSVKEEGGVTPYSKSVKVILSFKENLDRLNNHVNRIKLLLSRNRN